MTFLRWSLASLAAAYVLTIVGLAAFQRRLQYFPDRRLTELAQTDRAAVKNCVLRPLTARHSSRGTSRQRKGDR